MNIIKKFKTSSLTKSILLVSGGTALAQIINTLFSPILTRIYTPEDFGVLTVYTSLLTILTLVASLRYEWGITIAPDEKKAINVLAGSVSILIVSVTLITLITFIFGDILLKMLSFEAVIKYKFFIPIGVFFVGLYNIFVQWALRNKDFKNLSKTKVVQSVIQNIFKLFFGFIGLRPIGLIIGRIIGQSAGITTITKSLRKGKSELIKEINFKDVLWAIRRYKNFAIFSAPSQILNSTGIQLPVFFLTSIYGSATVGYYGLANTIVNMPMILIGISVADVYYSEVARIKNNTQEIINVTKKLFKRLIFIGIGPLLILLLFGPALFALVFGQDWVIAGSYARVMAPLVFARLIFTPFGRIFDIFEKQKITLMLDIIRLITVVIIFSVAHSLEFSSIRTILIYSVGMIVIYLITFILSYRVIVNRNNDL